MKKQTEPLKQKNSKESKLKQASKQSPQIKLVNYETQNMRRWRTNIIHDKKMEMQLEKDCEYSEKEIDIDIAPWKTIKKNWRKYTYDKTIKIRDEYEIHIRDAMKLVSQKNWMFPRATFTGGEKRF